MSKIQRNLLFNQRSFIQILQIFNLNRFTFSFAVNFVEESDAASTKDIEIMSENQRVQRFDNQLRNWN